MPLLAWRFLFFGVVAAGAFAYVFHLGNTRGSNARAYAAVLAELAATNAKVVKEKAEDANIVAREFASDAEAAKAFQEARPSLTQCIVSAPTVAALNPLGRDP